MTDTTTTPPRVRQWHDPTPPNDPAPVVALEWEHDNGLPTTGSSASDIVVLGQITDHDRTPICTPSPVPPTSKRPAVNHRLRVVAGWSIALALIAQCTAGLAVWTGKADNPFTLVLSAALAVCCVLLVAADYLTRRRSS